MTGKRNFVFIGGSVNLNQFAIVFTDEDVGVIFWMLMAQWVHGFAQIPYIIHQHGNQHIGFFFGKIDLNVDKNTPFL